jgi:hypothetical protein
VLHRADDLLQIIVRDFQFRRESALSANRRAFVWVPEDLLARFDLEAAAAFARVSGG